MLFSPCPVLPLLLQGNIPYAIMGSGWGCSRGLSRVRVTETLRGPLCEGISDHSHCGTRNNSSHLPSSHMSQAMVYVLYKWELFFFGHLACGILVPQAGIQPAPFVLEAQSQPLDHQDKSLNENLWILPTTPGDYPHFHNWHRAVPKCGQGYTAGKFVGWGLNLCNLTESTFYTLKIYS